MKDKEQLSMELESMKNSWYKIGANIIFSELMELNNTEIIKKFANFLSAIEDKRKTLFHSNNITWQSLREITILYGAFFYIAKLEKAVSAKETVIEIEYRSGIKQPTKDRTSLVSPDDDTVGKLVSNLNLLIKFLTSSSSQMKEEFTRMSFPLNAYLKKILTKLNK